MDVVALSQAWPFFMAGDDILRSKSGDRNSYNSGDWFNRIDWTLKSNGWGSGPAAGETGTRVTGTSSVPALADPNLKPNAGTSTGTFRHMLEMLVIRKTSGLFRLRNAEDIKKSVSFYNVGPDQVPGLIVERITNPDRFCFPVSQAVVLVNATPQAQTFSDPAFKNQTLLLHPVQAISSDPVVRTSTFQRRRARSPCRPAPRRCSSALPGRTSELRRSGRARRPGGAVPRDELRVSRQGCAACANQPRRSRR
jgi:pullulanase/glycogen debranching enzyme